MEAGWVCRFFYFDSSVTTLPEVDQLLMLEPNAAAKVDSINISSHKDLWEIAGEEGEEVVMCVCVCVCVCFMCESEGERERKKENMFVLCV